MRQLSTALRLVSHVVYSTVTESTETRRAQILLSHSLRQLITMRTAHAQ